MINFVEEEHPRDDSGKFTKKGESYDVASGELKNVDKGKGKDYTKYALRDDESIAVCEKITSGDLYELDELFALPVFKRIENKIAELNNKYGITNNIQTDERNQLRKNWINQFLTGDDVDTYPPNGAPLKKEYKATIIIGLPAAGKSTAIANPLSNEQGAFILDSDEMKKLIPEFKASNGGAANAVHKESKELMSAAMDAFVNGSMKGTNMVIPVIGDDAEGLNRDYIGKLHEAGYDVEIAYKQADTKTSANRVLSRAIKTGRFIPKDVVERNKDENVRKALDEVIKTDYKGKKIKKSKYSEI